MFYTNIKRHLALVLALVIAFSLVPAQVFAAELPDSPSSDAADASQSMSEPTAGSDTEPAAPASEEEAATEETEAAADYQAQIDSLLVRYLGSTTLTEEDIQSIVAKMSEADCQTALEELAELGSDITTAQEAGTLTGEDIALLEGNNPVLEQFGTILQNRSNPDSGIMPIASSSLDLDGDGNTDLSFSSSGDATITASGTGATLKVNKIFATSAGSVSDTITITNSSGKTATFAFNYTVEKGNSNAAYKATISNVDADTGSSCSVSLESGASFSVYLSASYNRFSSASTTLTMSNITMTEVADAATVTVKYTDNTLGSVTATYTDPNGTSHPQESIGQNGTATVNSSGITLTATKKSDAQFVAWIDENNKLVSLDNEYSFSPSGDTTLTAVFATTSPWFFVGDCLYEGWANAFSKGNTIVLANNATLPKTDASGNALTYEISSSQRLLIPYSESHFTSSTTIEAAFASEKATTTRVSPTVFRTLTIPNGVTINCSGKITVDALQFANSSNITGIVSGAYGLVHMESGSNIVLNNSAELRCYGYINGEGTVTASSGTTVYELFQISDWRGGSNTSSLTYALWGDPPLKGESFPVSQFYVQNIESNYVVAAGAKSKGCVALTLGGSTKTTTVEVISSSGLFNLSAGTVSRKYDATAEQIQYDVNGNGTIGNINITMSALGQNINMNSSDFVLNLPSTMSITVKKGVTLTLPQKLKLLPHTIFTIEEGAEVIFSSGAELILYDADDWNSGDYTYTAHFYPLQYSPSTKKAGSSKTMNESSHLIVNGKLTVQDGAGLYSTNQKKTSDGTGTDNASLSGTGTISLGNSTTGRTAIKEVQGSSTNLVSIPVITIQAPIAGIASTTTDFTNSMSGSATYYAYNGWWCTHADNLWTPANCINPKTCACEKTDGDPTGIHDWQGPTCVTAAICTVCGTEDSTRPATGVHTWDLSTGLCSVCKASMITLDATNVSVEGEVLLNLKFRILDHTDALTVTVTEQPNEVDTDGDNWTKQVSDLTYEEAKGRYVVSQGIAAGEMTGLVTVTFKLNDQVIPFRTSSEDTATVTELSKTVTDYAQTALDESDKENLKKMITQMVTFGGYAQQFFGTYTGSLAYSILSEVPDISNNSTTQTAKIQGDSIGIRAETQKLNLNAKIYMRTYFTLENGHNISEYTFTLTSPTGYGNSTTTTTFEPKQEGNRYYVDFENVPVAYWDDDHKITVTSSEGTYTVTSSVLAWVGRCIKNSSNPAEVNMAKAMISYNQAANTYFTAD